LAGSTQPYRTRCISLTAGKKRLAAFEKGLSNVEKLLYIRNME